MNVLVACQVVGVASLCAAVRHDVFLLVTTPPAPGMLHHARSRRTEWRHDAAQRARRHILACSAALLIFLACATEYRAQQVALEARLAAARMQPHPYGCLGNLAWSQVTWKDSVTLSLFPDTTEDNCAEYIRRTTASTWPNVATVGASILVAVLTTLCSAGGQAFSSFIERLPLPVQLLLTLGLAFVALYVPQYVVAHGATHLMHRAVGMVQRPPAPRAQIDTTSAHSAPRHRAHANLSQLEANTFVDSIRIHTLGETCEGEDGMD